MSFHFFVVLCVAIIIVLLQKHTQRLLARWAEKVAEKAKVGEDWGLCFARLEGWGELNKTHQYVCLACTRDFSTPTAKVLRNNLVFFSNALDSHCT